MSVVQLEEHHGVDVGSAYRTPDSAKSFIGFIAVGQCQGFHNYKITLYCAACMTGQLFQNNVRPKLYRR